VAPRVNCSIVHSHFQGQKTDLGHFSYSCCFFSF